MTKWVYLAVGSIAGGFSRFWIFSLLPQKENTAFPLGTFVVNITGCLLVGFFSGLAEDKLLLGANERILLMTGFCGAYTTFSAFILETSHLVRGGELARGVMNVLASIVVGFILFRLGAWIARAI